ncbi:MAG: hypothetical protein MJZ34_10510 [Paludibacteraceae bacterium]|nr:hypothetical protein [Paludibacteraceae bacterium]
MKNVIETIITKIDNFGKKNGIDHLVEGVIGVALALPFLKVFCFLMTLANIADNM